MGKNSWSPYSRPTIDEHFQIPESRVVGFKRGPAPFNLRKPDESVLPGSELFPCACALVGVILKLNKKSVYPIFLEIIDNLRLPDVWDYINSHIPFDDPLPQFVKITLIDRQLIPYPIKYIRKNQNKWRSFLTTNPNTVKVKQLIDEFLIKGLTPTAKLEYYHTYKGETRFNSARRNRREILPEKLPILFRAVLTHALAIVQNVDFYELDRLIIGHDYDLINLTRKPSTDADRKRKKELTAICKNANVHIVSYDTLLKRAEKFYRAYVLAASCADGASEYEITTSTLSHETKIFRYITGL